MFCKKLVVEQPGKRGASFMLFSIDGERVGDVLDNLPGGQRNHCIMFIGLDSKHEFAVLINLASWLRIDDVPEVVVFKIVLE